MRNLLLAVFILSCIHSIHAQVLIQGKILDKDNAPLPGVNIYINNTYDGTSSGPDGNFSFNTGAKDLQEIIASMVGYKEMRMQVDLDTLKSQLIFSISEEAKSLDDLVITAGVFEASDKKKSVTLKPMDVVTTAGATADIAGVMNTMPGTQKVGEKGRLFVRGGDDTETKYFIDGILVDNIYNLTPENVPSRMRFSPFLFSGTAFSTGGYSAEYGQALSGTLNMKTDNKALQTQTDLSLMSVGGSIAHTQKWNTGSVFAETYYINLKPYFSLVPQEREWHKAPSSWQNNFMLRQEFSKNSRLKIFYSNEFAGMSISQPSVFDVTKNQPTQLGNEYHYLNINYTVNSGKNWYFNYGVSGTYTMDTANMEMISVNHRQSTLHAKWVAGYDPDKRFGIRFGTDQYFLNYREKLFYSPDEFHFSGSFNDWVPALFAESDIYFSDKLIGRIGARGEYSWLSDRFSISPRISLAYKTGKYSQVSFASGGFNQRPMPEYLAVEQNLRDEQAAHIILNYQVVKNDRTFRIEAYSKTYSRLVKFDTLNSFDPSDFNNSGKGYARGLDIFWRDSRTIKNGDYWISYTLIDTKRLYRNFPVAAIPGFVSMHNISVVYKQFISKLHSQLGITYTYSSSRPYNDPNTDQFNHGLTPAFHDLSMNWSYLIKTNVILHFSATNILGRDNIFGYQYSLIPDDQGHYESIPVKQGARRFLFMGLFITFSKDHKTNQIRNL